MGKRNKAILGALPCSHGLSMLILMLFLLSWLCWFDRDEGSSIWHKTEHHYWTFMFIVGGPCWALKGVIQLLAIQTPDQAQPTDVLGLLCEVCRSLTYLPSQSISSLLKQCHTPSLLRSAWWQAQLETLLSACCPDAAGSGSCRQDRTDNTATLTCLLEFDMSEAT